MKKQFCWFLLGLVLVGCNQDDDVITTDPPGIDSCFFFGCDTSKSKLNVLWQIPLTEDTLECGSIYPSITNYGVLFSQRYCPDKEILVMVDVNTHQILWNWSEQYNGRTSAIMGLSSTDSKILYDSWHEIFCIDASTGETIWKHSTDPICGSPRSVLFNGFLYDNFETCGEPNSFSSLVRINVGSGEVETIYTHSTLNDYPPNLEPPGFWLKANGDTVLVFQNRTVGNSFPSKGRIDLFAYNMTQGSMEWEIFELDADGNSNVRPPVVWENKIYFAGKRMMYCIDAPTHEIIWTKPLYQMLMSNWLIANEKLIVKPDNDEMFALNPNTGEEIWKETGSGETCGNMVYYDGMVYFNCLGTGKLYAVDVETGEHVWAEHPPNRKKGFKDASFYDGVAVDPVRGVLYTSDEFFAMCIELPER